MALDCAHAKSIAIVRTASSRGTAAPAQAAALTGASEAIRLSHQRQLLDGLPLLLQLRDAGVNPFARERVDLETLDDFV